MKVKKWARRGAVLASRCSGLAPIWHLAAARRGVRVLAYHRVQQAPSTSYAVRPVDFERQMEHLRGGFRVLSFAGFLEYRDGGSLPGNAVMLTFDDGFRDFRELAWPLLRKHRFPALLFVIADRVGTPGFLGWGDLREMADEGLVEIGSHAATHRPLAGLPDGELEAEVAGSRRTIEDRLGRAVRAFCYPYGMPRDVDRRGRNAVGAAGYRAAFTSINGVNWRGTDPLLLRRTRVEWADGLTVFRGLLRGAMDPWIVVDRTAGLAGRRREYFPD